MPNQREEEEDYEEEDEEEYEEIEEQRGGKSKRGRSSSDRGRGSNSKRQKGKSAAVEEEEEEEAAGGRPCKSIFVDDEAIEDEDDEEVVGDEGELEGFIDNEPEPEQELDNEVDEVDLDGGGGRRMRYMPRVEEEEEDIEEIQRQIQNRYGHVCVEEHEDDTNVGQQSLVPSVTDPKLWLVKCAIGKERKVAGCLMQKCIDNPGELLIMSAIALDHLKGFVYVEAYKEVHVREACKGLRYVFLPKIAIVPIKEMTDVLCGENKSIIHDKWVRMKTGIYRGDLAKIVGYVPGKQQVRVKVIPRIDLQALANGVKSSKKKDSGARPDRVPALLRNMGLVRQLGVRVQSTRDPLGPGYIEKIDRLSGMIFKDGFHLKVVSDKTLKDAKPSLQELEEFHELVGDGDQTVPNRKKGESFMKGDAVVVTEGDLRSLVGRVDRIELGTVYIKPEMEGLPDSVAIKQSALQKCFKEGQHVKVVSGSQEGATGMVVKVDHQKQLITILSDATKEAICVFSDHAVESPEVNSGDKMGDSDGSRFEHHKTSGRVPRFSGGGRGRDGQGGLGNGTRVKLQLGPYKGCRGRIIEVKGSSVRVELESQMRTVVVDRLHCISDLNNMAASVTTPYCSGCETPMPSMRTPMRDSGAATQMPYMMTPMRDPGTLMPYMRTPMRDPGTPCVMTPRRDGMRTPPMTPARDPQATPVHSGMRTPLMTPMRDPRSTPVHGGMRSPPIY